MSDYFDTYCRRISTHRNTALWQYGDDSLRGQIEIYTGKVVPTGPFSRRLELEFSHRVIGVLVQSKRSVSQDAGDSDGGSGKSKSPSKRRAM